MTANRGIILREVLPVNVRRIVEAQPPNRISQYELEIACKALGRPQGPNDHVQIELTIGGIYTTEEMPCTPEVIYPKRTFEVRGRTWELPGTGEIGFSWELCEGFSIIWMAGYPT